MPGEWPCGKIGRLPSWPPWHSSRRRRAALIGYGKTPVSPMGVSVRGLDLDQAAANLKLAVARGFRDLAVVKSHPDAELLLSREDLKPLISEIAAPERSSGK